VTCLLCGATGDVRTALVAWRQPLAGRRFEAVPRCADHDGCRRRVAEQGEDWPLVETGKRPEVAEATA